MGLLRNGDGATVLLRADMDALPIQESTGLPYSDIYAVAALAGALTVVAGSALRLPPAAVGCRPLRQGGGADANLHGKLPVGAETASQESVEAWKKQQPVRLPRNAGGKGCNRKGDGEMRFMSYCVAVICTWSLALPGPSLAAEPVNTQGPLAIQSQGSFFIGGTVRHATGLSGVETGPEVTREGDITTGQMYVQYQVPAKAGHLPVIMIHGGGLSGQAWETTPDGRMGWREYFLRSGRPVYIVDQAGRARSGFDGTAYNEVRLGARSPKDLAPVLNIGHEFAWTWFRIGPKFGVPFPDTQFPVNAADEFYKMWIPDLNAALPADNPSYADVAALARKAGGAVVMGHSESFMFPERAALVDAAGIKGMISLESGYACATTFTPQQAGTLAKIPLLIVFADHQADAPEPFGSRWTTSMQQCRDFAVTLRRAGGDVTFLHLPEIGIHGNTHMFMLDKNNLAIADLVFDWIDRHVEHSGR